MVSIGIDIGSSSAKAAVLNEKGVLVFTGIRPTGWNSAAVAEELRGDLVSKGCDPVLSCCVATGYGRLHVPFAKKTVTEITCHAKGGAFLFGAETFTIIDIGGQDTKIIVVTAGKMSNFVMNDKCSAGTGRFLEVMANSLCLGPNELIELARSGSGITISSLCTVFAESEVISLIGQGTSKEDIAHGIVESIADKVGSQCLRMGGSGPFYLTGGLCESQYILEPLSKKLAAEVKSSPLGRYAGAIGAAVVAAEISRQAGPA